MELSSTALFFFFKQKTAYEIGVRLVGSEMCIRDRTMTVQLTKIISGFLFTVSMPILVQWTFVPSVLIYMFIKDGYCGDVLNFLLPVL